MGAHDDAAIKLPLLARTVKLDPLPGHDPTRRFAVVPDAISQPDVGAGYLVEMLDRRHVRILAWLREGGRAYACDRPLDREPDRTPEVRLVYFLDDPERGRVELALPGSQMRIVADIASHKSGYRFGDAVCDLGSYAGRTLDVDIMLAASFVAFALPKNADSPANSPSPDGKAAPGARDPRETLAELTSHVFPDALDTLAWRVENEEAMGPASGFERYAAHILAEAGAARVRAIAAGCPVDVIRLNSTNLFWARFSDKGLDPKDRATLLSVEAALNRLVFVAERLGDGGASADESACAQTDAAALRSVAAQAKALVTTEPQPNPLRRLRGAEGTPGGAWDVRTRLASALEQLALPFRLEYRYDCDVSRGVVLVTAPMPPAEAFSASIWDGSGWRDAADTRAADAASYAVRLATLLATCAFGASVGVVRAVVTLQAAAGAQSESAGGAPTLLSLAFDRIPFVMGSLSRVDHLADPALNAEGLLNMLAPADRAAAFDERGGLLPVEPLDAGMAERHPDLWQDTRPLPESLRAPLRADYAWELDVFHDDGPVPVECVREVMEEDGSSPLLATMRLEELATHCDADPLEGRTPLYCGNALCRLLVNLAEGDGTTRYQKAHDASYEVRTELAGLYGSINDPDRALAANLECVSLAPTTVPAYARAAACCADAERFREAAELLEKALRFTASSDEATYLYYRLAFALWMDGQRELGLACYVLALPDSRMGEQAKTEMRSLMEEMGVREAPDRAQASATLRAAGIPVAPSDELLDLAARVAVGLVDADIDEAAWPAVQLLGSLTHDDALLAVSSSLRKLGQQG